MKISTLLRLIAAIILLQTLYFKFTGAPESIHIFTKLGAEPWGRIASGVIELITAILLLLPPTVVYGALLSMGVMGGAIISHLTILGITMPEVNDKGELFTLAIIVFTCSAALAFLHWPTTFTAKNVPL